MGKKTDDILARRRLVRTIRAATRVELQNRQDEFLNTVESAALEEFDATVAAGGDYEAKVDELLGRGVRLELL